MSKPQGRLSETNSKFIQGLWTKILKIKEVSLFKRTLILLWSQSALIWELEKLISLILSLLIQAQQERWKLSIQILIQLTTILQLRTQSRFHLKLSFKIPKTRITSNNQTSWSTIPSDQWLDLPQRKEDNHTLLLATNKTPNIRSTSKITNLHFSSLSKSPPVKFPKPPNLPQTSQTDTPSPKMTTRCHSTKIHNLSSQMSLSVCWTLS